MEGDNEPRHVSGADVVPLTRPRARAVPVVWGSAVAPVAALREAPTLARYPEIDGQRGVATLMIVVFTVYQFCNVDHFLYRRTPAYTVLNSLDAAVPWFFVLIAFLLFAPIARSAIDETPTVTTRAFLTRRASRLLPAYYLVILMVWFTRQPSLPGDWRDLLEHFTFTQVFDDKRIFFTNGPAWAVSVVVSFYLVLIVLNATLPRACRRLPTRNQRVALVAATTTALAAISISWKAYAFAVEHHTTITSFTTWFGPVANLDNFAAGMAVAVGVVALGPSRTLSQRERIGLRATAAVILAVAFQIRQATEWSGVYFTTECSIGFGFLAAAALIGRTPTTSRPSPMWRPLAWLGTISYSVYLWHEPILLALNGWHGAVHQAPGAFIQDALVVVLASIIVGCLSHLVIETPTRRLGTLLKHPDPPAD